MLSKALLKTLTILLGTSVIAFAFVILLFSLLRENITLDSGDIVGLIIFFILGVLLVIIGYVKI